MRKLTLLILTLLSSVTLPAVARIRETRDFSVVLDEIEQGTLLVVDIDNTLLLPDQYLGTTKWGWKHVDKLKHQGRSKEEAIDQTSALMRRILKVSDCHLVDHRIAEVISRAQDWGIPVVGITNRSPDLGFITSDQLLSCGVNLMRTTPIQEDFAVFGQENSRQIEGVIHVGGMEDKGEALANFLRMSHIHPRRVVFVDDRERNVRDARRPIERLDPGIEYVGIWYREAERWLDKYSDKLVDVQLDTFGRILSNEEAEKLLRAGITQ